MIRRIFLVLLFAATSLVFLGISEAQAQQAFGRQWGHSYSTQDWNQIGRAFREATHQLIGVLSHPMVL